jgi:SAM-dependent methyltransferase
VPSNPAREAFQAVRLSQFNLAEPLTLMAAAGADDDPGERWIVVLPSKRNASVSIGVLDRELRRDEDSVTVLRSLYLATAADGEEEAFPPAVQGVCECIISMKLSAYERADDPATVFRHSTLVPAQRCEPQYVRAMLCALLALRPDATAPMLVAGLGVGTASRFLASLLGTGAKVASVEPDLGVMALAKAAFGFPGELLSLEELFDRLDRSSPFPTLPVVGCSVEEAVARAGEATFDSVLLDIADGSLSTLVAPCGAYAHDAGAWAALGRVVRRAVVVNALVPGGGGWTEYHRLARLVVSAGGSVALLSAAGCDNGVLVWWPHRGEPSTDDWRPHGLSESVSECLSQVAVFRSRSDTLDDDGRGPPSAVAD